MTVFRTVFLLVCVSICAPILTLPVSLSIHDDESEPVAVVPTAKKIIFYPVPVVIPASQVDEVIHKDPGELQHILAEKYDTPFLSSNLPDKVAQKISDLLRHPVTMELQDLEKESNLNFLKDTLVIEEDLPTTPEPEDSFTYFTDELLQSSTVSPEVKNFTDTFSDSPSSTLSQEVKTPNRTSRPELGRPPVKLLQRLLRDYLPVINQGVKKSTAPEKNPVITSLASKKLKHAPSMKYPVSGNGQFISLLNTLNVILNRNILPPSKTYEHFKVPNYNVSFPTFTVNVSETLLEPPHFESHATALSPSTQTSSPDGSAIDVLSSNVEAATQRVTSTSMSDKVEKSSTFSHISDGVEHEEAAFIDTNFGDQHVTSPSQSQPYFVTIDSSQAKEKISTLVFQSSSNLLTSIQENEATEEATQESTEKLIETTTFETSADNGSSVTESSIVDKIATGDLKTSVSTSDGQHTTVSIFEDTVSTNQQPEFDFAHDKSPAQFEHTQYFEGAKETTVYLTDDVETTSSATELTSNSETDNKPTTFLSTENLQESTVFETSPELTIIDKITTGASEASVSTSESQHTTVSIYEDTVSTNQQPELDFDRNTTPAQSEHTQYFEDAKKTTLYLTSDVETTSSATELTSIGVTDGKSTTFLSTENLQESTVFETSPELTITDKTATGDSETSASISESQHTTVSIFDNADRTSQQPELDFGHNATTAPFSHTQYFEGAKETTHVIGEVETTSSVTELTSIDVTNEKSTTFLSTENLQESTVFETSPDLTVFDKIVAGHSDPSVSTSNVQPTTNLIFEDTGSTNQQEFDFGHIETTTKFEHTQYFEGAIETTKFITDDVVTTSIPPYHLPEFFPSATEFTFDGVTDDKFTHFVSTEKVKENADFETPTITADSVTIDLAPNDQQPVDGMSQALSPPGDEVHTDFSTSSELLIESETTADIPIYSTQYLEYLTETEGDSYSVHQPESAPVQEIETNTEVVFESTTHSIKRPEMTVASSHLELTHHSQDSASETSPLTNHFTTMESMVGDQSDVDWTTVISELPLRPPVFDATPPVPWFLLYTPDFEGASEFTEHSVDKIHTPHSPEPEVTKHQNTLQHSELTETSTHGSDETEGDHLNIDEVTFSTQIPQHTVFESEVDYEGSFTILQDPVFSSSYEDVVDEVMVFSSTQHPVNNIAHETSSLNTALDEKSTISYNNPNISTVTVKPLYLEETTEAYVMHTYNYEGETDITRPTENSVISEVLGEKTLQSSTLIGGAQPSDLTVTNLEFDVTKVPTLGKYVYFVNEDTGEDTGPDTALYKHLKQGDYSLGFYDNNESDPKKLSEVTTVVTASQTKGLIFSTNPVFKSEQPETTQRHKTTTDSYPDTINDLIQSTISSSLETADHVTEGKAESLFLGDEAADGVTEGESTVDLPLPTTSRGASNSPPVENFTISQTTELLFTDPEEEEIEDPFNCESSPVDGSTTQVPTSKTGCKSKTTLKPNEIKVSFERVQDENTIPYDSETRTSVAPKIADVTYSKVPENSGQNLDIFLEEPKVQASGSLTTSSKARAEKLLSLLNGEPFIEGAEELEDNNEADQDYEFDGSGMKIVKGGQRRGKWIENLSNDQLKALIESIKLKHFRS